MLKSLGVTRLESLLVISILITFNTRSTNWLHTNLLLDIISKTSNMDITVKSINTISSNANDHLYEITIDVDKKETLVKFINDIDQISRVVSVERIIK